MAQIPHILTPTLLQFSKRLIPDNILYYDPTGKQKFGREEEFHTTIKFGLTQTYSKDQIQNFFKGTKPFYITIKGLDIFENEKFDVIKFNIESPELNRLNALFNTLPNQDQYKEYHPHITLAYVLSGEGKKFQGKNTKAMPKILIDTIKYSYPNGALYFKL